MNRGEDSRLQDKLIDYVQDAHSMELNVQLMLQSMIASTDDRRFERMLKMHLEQTKRHADRMDRRLEALGSEPSIRKTGQAILGGMPKGVIDQFRTDKPGKIARDAYVTEALEIAAYSLLEELAIRCGDRSTAAAARANRIDEEKMSMRISAMWGEAIDRTLADAGMAA